MLLSDVRINLRSLLAAKFTVRTLKTRLVAALVLHVTIPVALKGESVIAFRTVEQYLLRKTGKTIFLHCEAGAVSNEAREGIQRGVEF